MILDTDLEATPEPASDPAPEIAAGAQPAASRPDDRPKTKRFRRVAVEDRPAPELVSRQMQATAQAFKAFGTSEEARRFMNEVDERMGGRPVDIAGSSAEGLEQVIAAMPQRG